MMLFSLLLGILPSVVLALPTNNQTSGNVLFTQDSWNYYQVDAWLSTFMQEKNLSPANFLHDFPDAVHRPMDCSLDQPCTQVDDVAVGSSKEKIQISLVLASLTHFNDLFRLISRLWSNDIFLSIPINSGYPFRTALIEQFGDVYSHFSISDLSTTVPPEIIRVFINSIWYVPDALPNEALLSTIESVLGAVKKPEWAWKDYYQSSDQGISNIEQMIEDIFRSWRQQYQSIVANKGSLSVLDFIKGGQMLNIKYAKELSTVGWHTQAYYMFTRQILSLVLESNGIIVHRGNYDNMQPSDTEMGLFFSHDDPYTHETYSPVHFGIDADGNITRQYTVFDYKKTFAHTGIPERVVWGQSWQCFEATNNNDFTSNFIRAWTQPSYNKSLFIPDWDGTTDGFDAHNPLCTFNLAVNNQPSDIKTSWYIQQLSAACSSNIESIMSKHITIDYDTYYAVMLASDAWVYSTVLNRSSNGSEILASACQAAKSTHKNFLSQVKDDWVSNFEFNLIAGTIAHVGDILGKVAPVANAIKSSIRGGWSALFREKLPIVEQRPPVRPENLVRPSNERPSSANDNSNTHPNGESPDTKPEPEESISGADDGKDSNPSKPNDSNDGFKDSKDSGGAKSENFPKQDSAGDKPGSENNNGDKPNGQGEDHQKPEQILETNVQQKGDDEITHQAQKGAKAADGISGL